MQMIKTHQLQFRDCQIGKKLAETNSIPFIGTHFKCNGIDWLKGIWCGERYTMPKIIKRKLYEHINITQGKLQNKEFY